MMNAHHICLVFCLLTAGSSGFVRAEEEIDWGEHVANGLEQLDAEIDAIADSKPKKITAGMVYRKQGWGWNRAFRGELASKANAVKDQARYVQATYKKSLGWGAWAADGLASAAGHASVGQWNDAGVVLIDETVKSIGTTGGAIVGSGLAAGAIAGAKMLGIGGTVLLGPAGGIVGGAIGGVFGAIAGGIAYDAYAAETVEQWAQSMMSGPEDPWEQTTSARHEFLVREVVTVKQRELMNRYGYEGRMDEEVLLTKPGVDLPGSPPDASRPVIPDSCTLTITAWHPDHPESKAEHTLRIDSGVVTGNVRVVEFPKSPGQKVATYKIWFEGTIRDNQIQGKSNWTYHGEYEATSNGKHEWTQIVDSKGSGKVTFTLQIDGSVTGAHGDAQWTTRWSFRDVAPDSGSGLTPGSNSFSDADSISLVGRWRIGAAGNDGQD
jgi:hypothetical protein